MILHGEIRCYEFEDIIDITDSHHEKIKQKQQHQQQISQSLQRKEQQQEQK